MIMIGLGEVHGVAPRCKRERQRLSVASAYSRKLAMLFIWGVASAIIRGGRRDDENRPASTTGPPRLTRPCPNGAPQKVSVLLDTVLASTSALVTQRRLQLKLV